MHTIIHAYIHIYYTYIPTYLPTYLHTHYLDSLSVLDIAEDSRRFLPTPELRLRPTPTAHRQPHLRVAH